MEAKQRSSLLIGFEGLINRHSVENGSNTPDHILAEVAVRAIESFDEAVLDRAAWYGRLDVPGQEGPDRLP